MEEQHRLELLQDVQKGMDEQRRQVLLDVVQKYNDLLRAETKDMTNEERFYFLHCHIKAVSVARDMFGKAVEDGHGKMK